jgi:hypothetical protein
MSTFTRVTSYVVIPFGEDAYGPFDLDTAQRIAEQIEAADGHPADVVEIREWRDEWTETVAERIARTRRRA